MIRVVALLAALFLAVPAAAQAPDSLDAIARDYVGLMLEIGARDEGFVDAYYGPPEWRAEATAHPRDLADLAIAVNDLRGRVEAIPAGRGSLEGRRKEFLYAQLLAASYRLHLVRGESLTFEQEAFGLYGVALEDRLRPLEDYDPILARIEHMVPGEGPLAARVDAFLDRFVIPRDRLDAVMRAAIAECRRRTLVHIPLPESEAFTLEFVTGRSWSGYNWYQGDYRSLIQVNTDQPVRMSRAVDLGCHEGYPGHHAYNVLLEQELSRGRHWVEYMVYPLYSPQSFIAEGSANYGIHLAFPGDERLAFETRVLYPLAGLPTAEAATYNRLNDAIDELSGARITIARDLLEGRIARDRAIELLQRYQLVSPARAAQSADFIQQYRAYTINYGLGQQMVADYIERQGPDAEARWAAMRGILTAPTLPVDLLPRAAD